MPDSPCTAICTLDQNDVCLGCHRTAQEIAAWATLTDDQKQAVLNQIKEREHDQQLLARRP